MPKIHTQWDNKKQPTPSGEKEQIEWQEIRNEITKNLELRKCGTRNIYNEIQEAAEGTNIKEILSKYETKEEILEDIANNCEWGDTTKIKNNLLENLIEIQNREKLEELITKELKKILNKKPEISTSKEEENEKKEEENEKKKEQTK